MKLIAAALAVSMTAGCATQSTGANWVPVVDRPGPTYYTDLSECQAHATKVLAAADAGAQGAMVGAVVGTLIGAAFGLRGSNLGGLAAVGAADGGLRSAAAAEGGQRGIISRCMQYRGYAVLN